MPEALPPASTTRRGVNSSKFMGASFAAGKGLEKRVASNEKKITLLKNILKMRQQSENIGKTLSGIQESVAAIAETTDLQYQQNLQENEDERIDDEQDDRGKRESKLEMVTSTMVAGATKVLKPVTSFITKIGDFITNILLGTAVIKLLDWFGDSNNQGKIDTLVRFFKDWWPVIVGGLIAFAAPMLGTAGVIVGVVALLVWGVPKIIDAVKNLFGFGEETETKLEDESTGLDDTLKSEDSTIGKTFADADAQIKENAVAGGEEEAPPPAKETPSPTLGETSPEETPPPTLGETSPEKATGDDLAAVNEERGMFGQQELPSPPEKEQPPQKLAEGGFVRGPGGIDNVPARLTAGEFVMSKGAVEKWGPDMLAGMNASGGGTNVSTNFAFNGGGLVDSRPDIVSTTNLIPYEGKEYRKKFQFGGAVTGRGGRDNVPVKLTAGEFVMNRSAVKNFGSNTFAAMNRSGGGTNNPVGNKYFTGGLVQKARDVFTPDPPSPQKDNIKVVPIPASPQTQAETDTAGVRIPVFSATPGGGVPKEKVLGIVR